MGVQVGRKGSAGAGALRKPSGSKELCGSEHGNPLPSPSFARTVGSGLHQYLPFEIYSLPLNLQRHRDEHR
jgi:hypothetical protein